MKQTLIYTLPLLTTTPLVSSFLHPTTTHQTTTPKFLRTLPTNTHTTTSTVLSLAGFGAAGSSSSKKGKKKKTGGASATTTQKLKPKTQWNNFKSLTNESSVTVAMRVAAKEGSGDVGVGQWFDVGMIKSEGGEFTEVAVALQKGIITEHAKRLHPLQFLPKDKFEWGYTSSSSDDSTTTDDDWIILDVKQMTPPPPGAEKKIGFQGNADPSGYYASIGTRGYDGVGGTTKKDIRKAIN